MTSRSTRGGGAAHGVVARARRALVLVTGFVSLAACGGTSPPPGQALSATPDEIHGGEGDQIAPALGGGHLAYVDYPEGVGCAQDGSCRGTLAVAALGDETVILRVSVGIALPALGEGFVAWSEIQEPEFSSRGVVFMRSLGPTDRRIRRLSEESESVDVKVPPVAAGRFVAWYSPYGTPRGVRVHDVTTRETTTYETRMGGDARGLALFDGTLAYVDRSSLTWREEIVVVDLESGHERRLDVEQELGQHRIVSPALTAGWLAYKIMPPPHCLEECRTRVVSRRLTTYGVGGARILDLESETISRYGPLFTSNGSVLWLDLRDGPYALYGIRLDGTGAEAVRVTPEEAVLPWLFPAAVDGRRIAWVDGRAGSLDVHVGLLR